MDVLPYHFRICNIFGLWYTDNDYFLIKMTCRIITIFILGLFNLCQIVELFVMHGSVDEMTEVLFATMTYFGLLLKLCNFVTRQDEMSDLLDDFRSPLCRPATPEEEKILKKYSNNINNVYFMLIILSLSCGFMLLISALLSVMHNEFRLPCRIYNPYDINNHRNYWIAFLMQLFAIIAGIILNVSMDCIAYGFIMLATCQYEMSCSRYRNSTFSVKNCIDHHTLTQDIVLKVQHFFVRAIAPLFFFSLITLCASIFQMSQMSMASLQFLTLVVYLACMLSQVFFYCWYGNELVTQSQRVMDRIYSSTWIDYDGQERKNIWFAMLSAQHGSNISFHGQCRLSLDTFIWVIKTSYAAFSVLKQA